MTMARPPRRERAAKRPEVLSPRAPIRPTALLAALLVASVGCVEGAGKSGVPGEQDIALFEAPTELVFAERMTVGSRFDVLVVGRRADDEKRVLQGSFGSSDAGVLRVIGAAVEPEGEGDDATERQRVSVEVTGPGEAFLLLRDDAGAELDRVRVKAAEPKSVELLDGVLLGSIVDARLPERISLVDRQEVTFVVAATDRCGGPMLDVGGVRVQALAPNTPEGETPEATPYLEAVVADAGVWVAKGLLSTDEPLVPREVHLQLDAPGLAEPMVYEVKVVPAAAVDEVEVAVATAEPGVATVWGRAYSDDDEVIGLSYDWSSNARVTLSTMDAPLTRATISFPAEGEPADERPASVSAEVFGSEGEIDLLALMSESELQPGRVPPSEETRPPAVGPSCGGSEEACDPYQALLLGALLLGKRLQRRKRS